MSIFRSYDDGDLPSQNGFPYGDDGHGVSEETHQRQGVITKRIDALMRRADSDPSGINRRFSAMVMATWRADAETEIETGIRRAFE
jgi:hypothetical protein